LLQNSLAEHFRPSALGRIVGIAEGNAVGAVLVGGFVGVAVGPIVVAFVGAEVGILLGAGVSNLYLGIVSAGSHESKVGFAVGVKVVHFFVGAVLGVEVGRVVGFDVGTSVWPHFAVSGCIQSLPPTTKWTRSCRSTVQRPILAIFELIENFHPSPQNGFATHACAYALR
jgi:hypothetical protein